MPERYLTGVATDNQGPVGCLRAVLPTGSAMRRMAAEDPVLSARKRALVTDFGSGLNPPSCRLDPGSFARTGANTCISTRTRTR